MQKSLYPNYDVLALHDEWDEHTRQIVKKRLGPFQFKLLTEWEVSMLKELAAHLAFEIREEILTWIAAHIDTQLGQPMGEGERKPEIPPQKELVRKGLKAIDGWAIILHGKAYLELEAQAQLNLLTDLSMGQLEVKDNWDSTRQKELLKKLAGLTIDAYYSHPWVWSEIGYGGPAYPRGYVRIELGLTDPWEPQREGIREGRKNDG